MRINPLIGAGVLVASAGMAGRAHALTVTLGFSGSITSAVTAFTQTQTDGNSNTAPTNTEDSGYTVQLQASGTPPNLQPTFTSSTTTVISSGGGTTFLFATQTGLASTVPALLSSFNILGTSSPGVSVTEYTYGDSGNSQFALTTPLGSATMGPGGTASNITAPFAFSTPYSLTEVYAITFTGPSQNFTGTVGITGTTGAIPEPVSLSLLGVGLTGLGFARLRRRK